MKQASPFGLSDELIHNKHSFGRFIQALYPQSQIQAYLGTGLELQFQNPDGQRYEARIVTNSLGIKMNAIGVDIYPINNTENATLPPLPKPAPKIHHIPIRPKAPDGIDVSFSENGQRLDLIWDPKVKGTSLQAALDKALPGAVLSNQRNEHPFTYMTVTTPQNETWELTWLTGGIMQSYGVSLEKVDMSKSGQSQPLQTIKKTEMYAYMQPVQRAIRNPQDLAQLENSLGRQDSIATEAAQIDFQREMLLMVASGQKGTPGYGVNIESAEIVDNKMVVRYSEQSAEMGGIYAMVITNPSHIVKTPRFDGPIEFVKVD